MPLLLCARASEASAAISGLSDDNLDEGKSGGGYAGTRDPQIPAE
jgi:hypothetical protein